MSDFRGDYMGFTYGIDPASGKPIHSSDLGIVRVSDGSRFNENLLPTMQDKTVPVPGGDGTYYFGSYFTQRQIPVSFAFDSLTEEQIAKIKRNFGDKKIHDLIFDEMPYKTYRAKVTGTATLKYIPFSEGETNRLYRGEGTIQFTCYEPYAICRKKWLDEYDNTNKGEWKEASRLLSSGDGYDQVHGADAIKLYNAGDTESHFTLRIDFYDGKIPASSMTIETMDSSVSKVFKWSELTSQGKDTGVIFNSKINLIEGCDSNGKKTGTVYNKFITEGDFFKIPLGESTLTFDKANGEPSVHSIEYFYYYI